MPKLKPIVTYSFASVLVLWVLLGAITLPNANRWFKSTGSSIEEDLIFFDRLNETNTPLTEIPKKFDRKNYRTDVFAIDNTPEVPAQGIQGLLYDRGESCHPQHDPNTIPMPSLNISKIALIQQSESCFLTNKLIHAEMEGAVAALVFNNGSFNQSHEIKGVKPKTVHIPAYYIDYYAGITLLRDLESQANQHPSEGQPVRLIRVQLVPSESPKLDHWQFALVIVGIMLITSIMAITVLQCHMWKIARLQQQQELEENESLTLEEQRQLTIDDNFWRDIIGQPPRNLPPSRPATVPYRLDQTLVDLLPTRLFRDSVPTEKSENCNLSVDSFGTTCELSSCVICLDQFEAGDILRRLPCHHEYHRDCIDLWLTKKSGSCPLCLHRIEIPTVPSEAHSREMQEAEYYANMPDLAQTWNNLNRDEEIALRQHPFAYNPTPPEALPLPHNE